MAVPLNQALRVGAYVSKQHLIGRKRYPLVLMLEPLFRCNLACAGCGKIDYPAEILNQRLSVEECLEAVDECGAPVVVDRRRRTAAASRDRAGRPGRHRAQEVRHRLHQRPAAGKEDASVQAEPVFLLVGASRRRRGEHDASVCQDGRLRPRGGGDRRGQACRVPHHHQLHAVRHRRAGARLRLLRRRDGHGGGRNHRLTRLCLRACARSAALPQPPTHQGAVPRHLRAPGEAPGKKQWSFNQSSMFLDFLAGNQTFHCTPWGNPDAHLFSAGSGPAICWARAMRRPSRS